MNGDQERPIVFVGSSNEKLGPAQRLAAGLEKFATVRLWPSVHEFSSSHLADLHKAAQEVDFAVLVLAHDDDVTREGQQYPAVRDNVLFELGLFMGELGPSRVFGVYDFVAKLAADLNGINWVRIESWENLDPAIRGIRERVNELGPCPPRVRDPEFAGGIDRIQRNLSFALRRTEIPAFRGEVRRELDTVVNRSEHWKRGEIIALRNYSEVLKQAYRDAKVSIFSTSLPDYEATWSTPLGMEILNAQRTNTQAQSTRVFVFSRRDEIREENREEFRRHRECRIRVLIYVDQEDDTFDFPPDLSKDWTIIDGGRAVGVTSRYEDGLEARWYFDHEKAALFREYERRLRAAAEEWSD
ncbi:MAG: nucleotide-binding protein [Planctomycetes bacterium]|nr:nucleotide-binding protein [Planctomycetota bacterium]